MILVYSSYKNGVYYIDGYRIPGHLTGELSTDVPYKLYSTYKNCLVQASYTKDWMEAKFCKPFPNLSFTLDEISLLNYDQLVIIAQAMNLQLPGKTLGQRLFRLRRALKG